MTSDSDIVRQHKFQDEATLPPQPDDGNTIYKAGETSRPQTSLPSFDSFGEYDQLSEIARGGMGVVYKARQKTLGRTVALKMILAGQLATADDVQRFQREAEAAATLDHSAIVPIYEIGEHKGQHYFSMGFVDGQSLAQAMAAGPIAIAQAVAITQQVAEAIAYAHDKGIIHRDLKPANILLNADGQPRITDFGLAKQIGKDNGPTLAGDVMGTPNYMPPEQAGGDSSQVGTRSDIYSLGAILYCLMTGRPPFQSANPLDTLVQVLNKEPVPPRQLNPEIPRDIETICLKCLEKSPERRYASARELSAELQRWLNGEPILARPISFTEKTLKWVKRHPALAVLTGFAMVALFVILTGGTWYSLRLEHALDQEQAQRRLAQTLSVVATGEKQRVQELTDELTKLTTDLKSISDEESQQSYRNRINAVVQQLAASEIGYDNLRFATVSSPDREIAAQLQEGLIVFPAAATSKITLKGEIVWKAADDARRRPNQHLRATVNGFQQALVDVTPKSDQQERDEFQVSLDLQQAAGNRVRLDLLGLPFGFRSNTRFRIGCANPPRTKRLHVIAIDDDATDEERQWSQQRMFRDLKVVDRGDGQLTSPQFGQVIQHPWESQDNLSSQEFLSRMQELFQEISKNRTANARIQDSVLIHFRGPVRVQQAPIFNVSEFTLYGDQQGIESDRAVTSRQLSTLLNALPLGHLLVLDPSDNPFPEESSLRSLDRLFPVGTFWVEQLPAALLEQSSIR